MNTLEKLAPRKRIHFVGIGGVGMSGLARILLERGYLVSGSDIKETASTKKLESLGARIFIGHDRRNIEEPDLVVCTSCLEESNPEIICAREKNIRLIKRAILLNALMEGNISVTVSGAHGKTTTTALISFLMKNAGLNPGFSVGADVPDLGGNAGLGAGRYFVAEADESDGSFLCLDPNYAVITNIDKEHLDYYKDLNHIIGTYAEFISKVKNPGVLFCCGEDKNILKALKNFKGKVVTYGFKNTFDFYPEDVCQEGTGFKFSCVNKGKRMGGFALRIPGLHNVLNALACIAVAREFNIEISVIMKTLSAFRGAERRFQIKDEVNGIMIVDDYAHHPTEIKATLEAAKTWKRKRVIGVFQPHRYSRTKFLKKEFGRCFDAADKVIITDIYPAFEAPIKGVAARTIYEEIKKNGHPDAQLLPKDKINDYLAEVAREGDLLMMLGAGDINKLSGECIKMISAKQDITRSDGWRLEKIKIFFRGEVRMQEPLAGHTTIKIGGVSKLFFIPVDDTDLAGLVKFLAAKNADFFLIGGGSNLLISEENCPSIVIKLESAFFKGINKAGDKIYAAAGVLLSSFMEFCKNENLSGAEFLSGIPGTIGGAIIMNAGVRDIAGADENAFLSIANIVESVRVMDKKNAQILLLDARDIKFGYRNCSLKKDYLVLGAYFNLVAADKLAIESRIKKFWTRKKETQEIKLPNAGCVFKNPPSCGYSAGWLIEQCSLKGKAVGGAQVSLKHSNFIVNKGEASFNHVISLMGLMQDEVQKKFGVSLEPEVDIWDVRRSYRIGVLMGGFSSEREISLKSGNAVAAAVKKCGYDVRTIDFLSEQEFTAKIKEAQVDCIFNALHGKFGEDGRAQKILEEMKIPYTGSAEKASRLAMDKSASRKIFAENGLFVPPTRIVSRENIVLEREFCKFPLVVKPAHEGSSIGLAMVESERQLYSAIEEALKLDEIVLIEHFIPGREITVGILEDEPLAVVEVIPKNKFYDFHAKYTAGMTEYLVPASFPKEVYALIQETAKKAHHLLGCRCFSRVDIIVTADNRPVVLEVNAIPGLTATSLLPKAAAACNINFEELCDKMILSALRKKTQAQAASPRQREKEVLYA